jgi:hypothetical protein
MKPTVYIETTVISYLTAWQRKDPSISDDMAATRRWWDHSRESFELFTSAAVVEEAAAGDSTAAAARLAILDTLPELPGSESATALAEALVVHSALPSKARIDALHIAIAAVNGMNYLLTWNCRHLANATLRTKIEQVCRQHGYEPPIICTPKELTEVQP